MSDASGHISATGRSIPNTPEIVIIGSGMGGASLASGLAPTGVPILILERGERLEPGRGERSTRAIFVENRFLTKEQWLDGAGNAFNPGNFYYVGGNSKMYGAALFRFRREDFTETTLPGGQSPAWPLSYEDLEPWYTKAETLYRVRGALGQDPTEPPHAAAYPYRAIPDEPPIAAVRQQLVDQGLHPFSLPLGVDIEKWLEGGQTPFDGHPDTRSGKMDAETCGLESALAHENVRLETGALVTRLETSPDGRRVVAVHYVKDGETHRIAPRLVVVCAGAVNSAVLLLRSSSSAHPRGLANQSDQVGRNFMNHNCAAMLTIDPRRPNGSIYQKTIGLNDFYLGDGEGGPPLGNVQLLGKIDGPILGDQVPFVPRAVLDWVAGHCIDWYLMCEDLPDPESRVRVDGDTIILNWTRSNMEALRLLTLRMRKIFRACGFPLILCKRFDRRTPSHQCGTIRIGDDPATSPLNANCRAWEVDNLYVVDASCLPTSAALNPALTVAAVALRTADRIAREELGLELPKP